MDNITIITWPRGRRSLMAHLLRLCLGKVWDAALVAAEGEAAGGAAQVPGRSYLVEYEAFPQAVVARFESFVAKGGEDSAAAFRRFASHDFTPYDSFAALWVRSDFVRDQVVIDAAELRVNALAWLPWALGVLAPGMEVSATTLARAAKACEAWAARNPVPELAAFRHYNAELFAQLAHLKLRRDVVQRVFHEVMGRDIEESNILPLQVEADRDSLRERLMNATKFGKRAGVPADGLSAVPQDAPRGALSKDRIALAYQLFLGRHPSETEVAYMLNNNRNLDSLRATFLSSKEFLRSYKRFLSRSDAMAQPIIIHLHVPKTAGSSLNSLLEPHYSKAQVVNGVGGPPMQKLAEMPPKDRDALRLITGHAPYGVHELLSRPHLYLCLLRQPGPRLYSFYKYILWAEDHPLHITLKKSAMTFGNFLTFVDGRDGDRLEFDNGQLRRLAGSMTLESLGREDRLLPMALEHLFADDMIFGLSEDFGAFLERIAERGIIFHPQLRHDNKSSASISFEDAVMALTDTERDVLRRFTVWDQKFYDAAQSHLRPSLSETGEEK